jgi:hypothetical protein
LSRIDGIPGTSNAAAIIPRVGFLLVMRKRSAAGLRPTS